MSKETKLDTVFKAIEEIHSATQHVASSFQNFLKYELNVYSNLKNMDAHEECFQKTYDDFIQKFRKVKEMLYSQADMLDKLGLSSQGREDWETFKFLCNRQLSERSIEYCENYGEICSASSVQPNAEQAVPNVKFEPMRITNPFLMMDSSTGVDQVVQQEILSDTNEIRNKVSEYQFNNNSGSSETNTINSMDDYYNEQHSLTKGKVYKTIVTAIDDFNKFYGQLFEVAEDLNLWDQLKVDKKRVSPFAIGEKLQLNDDVLAWYDESKDWFRAKVIGIENKKKDVVYEVLFVDYGNKDDLEIDLLAPHYDSLHIAEAPKAICFEINNSDQTNDERSEFERYFSLKRGILNKLIEVKVVEKILDSYVVEILTDITE